MSDNYIDIIPEKPGFVPAEGRREEAVSYFRKIATKAEEVTASVSAGLEFIHCAGNFEEIRCPSYKALVELDWWQQWMNEDFGENGFKLGSRTMRCP